MKKLLIILALLLPMTGCQLVAPYDQVFDSTTMSLETDMETTLLNLRTDAGTPAASFENYRHFYSSYRARIQALKIRASAFPNNELTIKELDDLSQNLDILIELHEKSWKTGINAAVLIPIESSFTTIFTAIIKLETAKQEYRNGSSANTTGTTGTPGTTPAPIGPPAS